MPEPSPPSAQASAPGETARPVFCIIDPSLKDFIGHHYAYDEAVARGAQAAGYRAVTLAHRDMSAAIADETAVFPCFRHDIWGQNPWARHVPERWRVEAEIFLANRDFLADLRAGLARVAPPPGSVLFAHMIFRHQLPALAKLVREQPPQGPLEIILLLRYQPAFYDNPACANAFAMLEQAAASGRRVRLASDSARLARELGSLTSLPIEVMPIPHTQERHARAPEKAPDAPLRLVTLGNARDEKGFVEILDAIRLLRRQGALEGLEFTLQANDAAANVQRAIDAFTAEQPEQVTLLRDALSPAEYEATLLAADVILVPYWRDIYRARTSGVFLEALAAGKIVIATRDTWMSDELASHGAGVLVDDHDPAAIAAAITAVRAGLPALRARAEAGRALVLSRHSPAALIRQAIDGPAPEPAAPEGGTRRVAVFYPWGNLTERRSGAALRCMLMMEKISPLVEEIRVLQDGPYEHMPTWERVTGSLFRLPLLPFYWLRNRLRKPATARRGAVGDWWAPAWRQGNISVSLATLRMRHHSLRAIFRSVFHLVPGHPFGQERMLWFFLERSLDRGFQDRAAAMVAWADVVLLEYPLWAGVIGPICKAQGKRLIITNYDVLAQQVTGFQALHRLTARLEKQGMAMADQAVTVSRADQAWFAAAGISSIVIPNPIDQDHLAISPPCDLRQALRALYDVVLPEGPVCLFVGSHFGPNIDAMQRVRSIAQDMAGDARPTAFVIAGDCAPPGRGTNWVALGSVDSVVLALLYHVADLVLVPLCAGTGSSVKIIEAMAAGKALLGTSVALRGLALEPGQDCLMEDDFSHWPGLIRTTLQDPAGLARLATAARQAAQAYDFRVAFNAYLPLLGLQEKALDLAARSAPERPNRMLIPRALLQRSAERVELALFEALLAMPELADEPLEKAQLRALVLAAGRQGRLALAERMMERLQALPAPRRDERVLHRLDRALQREDFAAAQRMLRRLRSGGASTTKPVGHQASLLPDDASASPGMASGCGASARPSSGA